MPRKAKERVIPNTYKFTNRGRVYWRYRYYFPFDEKRGEYPTPRCKDFTAKTAELAERKMLAETGGKTVGHASQTRRSVDRSFLRFADWLRDVYFPLLEERQCEKQSHFGRLKEAKSRLTRFCIEPYLPYLEDEELPHARVNKLTPIMLRNFFDALRKNNEAWSARVELKKDFAPIIRELLLHKFLDGQSTAVYLDPIQIIRPAELGERAVFDPDQIYAKLFDEALPLVARTFVATMFTTMLRPSEMFALKWSDIDFKEQAAFVGRRIVTDAEFGLTEKPGLKKGDSKTIVLIPELLEMLQRMRVARTVDSPYVFVSKRGKRLNKDLYNRGLWREHRQQLGLPPGPDFYTVKHAGNSFIAPHVPGTLRGFMMGHSTDKLADSKYLRAMLREVRAASELFRPKHGN